MPPGGSKVGVYLEPLRRPLKKALEFAARAGVQAVELDARGDLHPRHLTDSGIRHLRKILDDYNVKLCALRFRTRRGYQVLEDLDARIDATKRVMQLAYQLRAPLVINQVGRVPETEDDPQWSTLLESLADLGRHGERVGALLAAQTGSEEGADLKRLLDAVPSRGVAAALHPGNLIINGFSARDAAQALGDSIVYVHAADAVRDLARGRGLETQLGRGAADFPELVGLLEEHGYRGYYAIDRSQVEGIEQQILDAVAYLRELGV